MTRSKYFKAAVSCGEDSDSDGSDLCQVRAVHVHPLPHQLDGEVKSVGAATNITIDSAPKPCPSSDTHHWAIPSGSRWACPVHQTLGSHSGSGPTRDRGPFQVLRS
jgi:hypothetical protein